MTLSIQFYSMLAMIAAGIAAGALADLSAAVIAASGKRSFIRRHAFWFELAVWLLIGAGAFLVLLAVRDGAWRMYDPAAQAAGMLLYAAVFHYPLRLAGRVVHRVVIVPLWYLIRLLLFIAVKMIRAIVFILSLILSPVRRIGRNLGKILQNKFRLLYNKK